MTFDIKSATAKHGKLNMAKFFCILPFYLILKLIKSPVMFICNKMEKLGDWFYYNIK